MVAAQMAEQSVSKPKTDYTKLAIDGMNDQILPGGLGGVGGGFIAPEASYGAGSVLYGAYGGLVDTTPTPYSSASALYGPGMGLVDTSQAIDSRMTREEVERQVLWDLNARQAREDSVQGGQLIRTGGSAGGMRVAPSQIMVRNGNWDSALNAGADAFGLLGEFPAFQQDLQKLSSLQAEGRIEMMRGAMKAAGMSNVPDYSEAWVKGSDGVTRTVRDYNATVGNLQSGYEGFVRDQRLRATWGDAYQSMRLGKSQMTVLEFEKRVLDLQQNSVNQAYDKGVELIRNGELKINGDYARTLGNFVDRQARDALRTFSKVEGISESRLSDVLGVNRSINDGALRGTPDNRIGINLFADTTLAAKSGSTTQIMKWNSIMPDSNYVIIRPTNMPGVSGSYVIPPTSIHPYQGTALPAGRRI